MDAKLARYVPKRLIPHVQDVFRDSDGIWAWGDDFLWDGGSGSHTIHEETVARFREALRYAKVLDPSDPPDENVKKALDFQVRL